MSLLPGAAPIYIKMPQTAVEARTHMVEMTSAGLNGCIASADATHVGMERCPFRLSNLHAGPKLKMPSRTYNIAVNHRRQILSSTPGHPARWNDKTIQLFDEFMLQVRNGDILTDVTFDLYERNGNGDIITVTYEGVWIMVDNGYLAWSTLVPPYKDAIHYSTMRFSKWLESMRKDVENTFGILKGRFRVLKTGIRLHGINATDKMWKTCCALHNFLLDEDGLNEQWNDGVLADWQGEMGNHNSSDVRRHVPFSVRRLTEDELRGYDTSGMGVGDDESIVESPSSTNNDGDSTDTDSTPNLGATPNVGVVRRVRDLSLDYFRERLVEHFDIQFKNNRIKWPTRMAIPNPLD